MNSDETDLQNSMLETMGFFAAGIVHDLNNFLTILIPLMESLKKDPSLSKSHCEEISIVLSGCHSLKEVGKRFLNFSNKTQIKTTLFTLNQTVEETIGLFSVAKIKLTPNLLPDLPPISGCSANISIALMNICINAVQSVGKNSDITLSTGIYRPDGKKPDQVDNLYVYLKVKDNGVGMSKEDVKRAFDPFFTTKKEGNGIGLTMARKVVEEHGGSIEIESTLGKGTQITIFLPTTRNTIDS